MAKDPAFLFYSSDFLNGVSDLTMEERGQYITMLCLQHQKGELSEKTIRLSVGSVSVDVLSKFTKLESGSYVNERLIEEIDKRANFVETRRSNGSKGGRPSKNKKPLGYPKQNLMEDVNENENTNDNVTELSNTKRAKNSKKFEPPDLIEFLNYAEENSPVEFWRIEDQVKLKFKAWTEAGWHNGHGKKIINWKTAILNTLPHFKPINNGINHTSTNRPSKIGSMPIDEVTEFLSRDRSEYLTGTPNGNG